MNNRYEWTYITDNPIVVDLSCKGGDYHEAIKDALGFPEYYGRNWDAFWDLLDDFCSDSPQGYTIHFTNLHILSSDELAKMKCVISLAQKEHPAINIIMDNG